MFTPLSHTPPVLARLLLSLAGFFLIASVLCVLVGQARTEVALMDRPTLAQAALARLPAAGNAQTAKARGDYWLHLAVPPRPDLAQQEYCTAVHLNPHQAIHWTDWGAACGQLGEREQAEKAFAMADRQDPNNQAIQLSLGNYFLEQGDWERAATHHARAIELDHGLARAIYPVYWNGSRPPRETAKCLLGSDPDLLRAYFLDSLVCFPPSAVKDLWQYFHPVTGIMNKTCGEHYFTYLLDKAELAAARGLWRQLAHDDYQVDWNEGHPRAAFWNGNFEYPVRFEGGLEWTIAQKMPAGAQATIAAKQAAGAGHALWLHFSGTDNVAFSHVRHRFFLDPGTSCTLRFEQKTLGITTDNGPYVQLVLHGKPAVYLKSPALSGSTSLAPALTFTVPEGAIWGEVIIRRDRSDKLNNKIKGDCWFDHFTFESQPMRQTAGGGR